MHVPIEELLGADKKDVIGSFSGSLLYVSYAEKLGWLRLIVVLCEGALAGVYLFLYLCWYFDFPESMHPVAAFFSGYIVLYVVRLTTSVMNEAMNNPKQLVVTIIQRIVGK